MSITPEKLEHLPTGPGVYIFKKGREILYVGKATSLKSRVKSYLLEGAVLSRGPKITKLIAEASKVDFEETDSVLEALIREAALIKKYQPPYNVREKSDTSFNYVVITDEPLPRVFTMRGRELTLTSSEKDFKAIYGPFPHGAQLRDAMKIVRKIFPYRGKNDAPTPDKKRRASKIYEEIGLAPRAGGAENPKEYARTIRHLRLFFEGKKKKLIGALTADMKRFAKARDFESAEAAKRQIFALEHVNDIALIKRESGGSVGGYRIEAYDIAHTAGRDVVGVMAVVESGEPSKNEYRMFRVRGDGSGKAFVNDTAALAEILERRLGHPEWALPKLIVVDGGVAHLRRAEKVLEENGIGIPVVAVTKNDRHRPEKLLGDSALIKEHGDALLVANDEAHRFAVRYHRDRRSKSAR